jgi:hypothetical protein
MRRGHGYSRRSGRGRLSLTLAVIIDIAAHEEGGGLAMQYATPELEVRAGRSQV